jgi:hypothetical protein
VNRGRDGGYSVVGEEECAQAFEKGKIAQYDDTVICEVYRIVLVLPSGISS